ncbi:hypothetical protein C8R45DRAFT_939646 [Mycena sanguinolenta]|nr:hypothetical protein C8R45DRAFT_939646 [Mycena sanguinolenta]
MIQAENIDTSCCVCKTPLKIRGKSFFDSKICSVTSHLLSDGSSVETNFAVGDDGGITQSGNAEASEAEVEEDNMPPVLGRGQRKKLRSSGPGFKNLDVHGLGVTVTYAKIVQFTGGRHPSPEPLVELLQYTNKNKGVRENMSMNHDMRVIRTSKRLLRQLIKRKASEVVSELVVNEFRDARRQRICHTSSTATLPTCSHLRARSKTLEDSTDGHRHHQTRARRRLRCVFTMYRILKTDWSSALGIARADADFLVLLRQYRGLDATHSSRPFRPPQLVDHILLAASSHFPCCVKITGTMDSNLSSLMPSNWYLYL